MNSTRVPKETAPAQEIAVTNQGKVEPMKQEPEHDDDSLESSGKAHHGKAGELLERMRNHKSFEGIEAMKEKQRENIENAMSKIKHDGKFADLVTKVKPLSKKLSSLKTTMLVDDFAHNFKVIKKKDQEAGKPK